MFEAVACAAYNGETGAGLSFEEGAILHVHERTDDNWWYGEILSDGSRGYFPAAYVSILGFAR